MLIRKYFMILSAVSVLLISCRQKMELTLNDNREKHISGHVEIQLTVLPVFGAYLKNLDLFSGIEAPQDTLPSGISDPLAAYRYTQKNYKQSNDFDPKSGTYTVRVSFDFEDLQTLIDPKVRSIIAEIMSISSFGDATTIRAEFNRENRKKLEEHLPILLPLPEGKSAKTEKEYFKTVAQGIIEFQEQLPAAEKEIASSKITAVIITPRPIIEIIGGKTTNRERTKALIEIPLTDILFLEKDYVFSITF